jgi:hypothetical protein
MRAWCVAVLLLLLPGVLLVDAAEQASYDALVAQLKAGNTAIDYQALRFARSELPGYNPYDALADPEKGDLVRAMGANDADRVAAIANDIIARDYTDIDAHAALSTVLERRGQRYEAAFELAVANGLLNSIEQSGDGMTPETAYVVIGIAEEYSLLGAKGLQVAKQSLLQTERGPVDALDVVNPTNNESSTVYFNVSRLFAAMSRLGGVQKAP